MFTSQGGAGYYWASVSQKLFNFSPECGKTEKLFYVDLPLSTETDPSLMNLPDMAPDITVATQLLDDIQERPGHDPGGQGGRLLVLLQLDGLDVAGLQDVVLAVHFP